MTERAKRIMKAYKAEDTYNFPNDGVAAALREVVIEVILKYMQYAEWEIVNKIEEAVADYQRRIDNNMEHPYEMVLIPEYSKKYVV
jgi:hypothetical protein